MLENELAHVEPYLARYGYAAVFVAIFVEGFGIPAPGQTLLVAAAILAARGQLSITALLLTGFAASAGGTLVGWAIGHYGGRQLLGRFAGKRLEKIDDLFNRWGGGFVLLGRFVDGARQLCGIASGALSMPLGPFLFWNVLGGILWTAFWGLGTWAFTRDFHALAAFAHGWRVPLLVAALVVAIGVLLWLQRGRSRTEPAR